MNFTTRNLLISIFCAFMVCLIASTAITVVFAEELLQSMVGEAPHDWFGFSVSEAGDVNADGYDDVIVGAPCKDDWVQETRYSAPYHAGDIEEGRAYIFYGGETIGSKADVILTGEVDGDRFGWSVSGAGDVNADGYDDVIVGAIWNDVGGEDAGRAYIFYGGGSMDSKQDVILTGEDSGDWFGFPVSGAGDVNGDGYDDVIVGAYNNDAGGDNAGRAYIYFGGGSMDSKADVILTGEAAGDYFGMSVSGAGDVNNDTYDDVIVGALYNDAGGDLAGRAYIFYGGDMMDSTPDVILTGEAAFDKLGFSVSGAGDVNADGYDDVIVGAKENDAGGRNAGRAYIFYGGDAMDRTPDVTFTGEAERGFFGTSVSGAGDVNGDGYDDVIVGAGKPAGGEDAGGAYIFYGNSSLPSSLSASDASVRLTRHGMRGAGDVNGDGYDDVIVGEWHDDEGGRDAGKVYIYAVKGVVPYQFNPGGFASLDPIVIALVVVVVALVSIVIVVLYRRTRYQKKKNK